MGTGGDAEGRWSGRHPDVYRIWAARGIRSLVGGALSVAFVLELRTAQDPGWLIGLWLGLAVGGAALWSLGAGRLERRGGRRWAFALGSLGVALGGLLLWIDLAAPAVVLAALLLGGVLVGGTDIGLLPALEQASLASASPEPVRTHHFSVYNLVGYAAGAVGAALAGLPLASLGWSFPLLPPSPRGWVLLLAALAGLALFPLYLTLSGASRGPAPRAPATPLSPEVRGHLHVLASLFSVDAFAGGLVAPGIVVYWLTFRYGPGPLPTTLVTQVSLVMALGNAAAGISLLLAAPLARRLGLIATMVFTHLPSDLLLAMLPFAPTLPVAGALWIARSTLSQMDVPTRQSFVQALVPVPHRTHAAGLTGAARSTSALGSPLAGPLVAAGAPWIVTPFVLAGSLKAAYDLILWKLFRRVRVSEGPG